MTINKEALLAVADVIEYADRFNLGVVVAPLGDDGTADPSPVDLWNKCGTVGCVWGWTAAWADIEPSPGGYLDEWQAAEELGLDDRQSSDLFYWDGESVWVRLAPEFGWELESDMEYKNHRGDPVVVKGGLADPSKVTAAQAAEVLRRIANGKVTL